MYEGRIHVHYQRESQRIGSYVLYWMQQSQRVPYNHALAWSIEQANDLGLPLVVCFGITDTYPDANERHYSFMVEGLKETAVALSERGIPFKIVNVKGSPDQAIDSFLGDVAVLVMDKGYLRHQRDWRAVAAGKAYKLGVPACFEVETDLIVPIERASQKEEYAARTIRKKLWSQLDRYAIKFSVPELVNRTVASPDDAILVLDDVMAHGAFDRSVKPSNRFKGGYSEALNTLESFLVSGLSRYKDSNSPACDGTSKMSLYLHFGQISPLEIYLRVRDYVENHPGTDSTSVAAFLEQLMVRRELAFNFIYYREGYDAFGHMTYPWAYQTMRIHDMDERPYLYDLKTLEECDTHDPYWNAAMKEMVKTGYMHNYMRMYWCKKIIEWSETFEAAYERAVYLNNKYFIDGRDANSYVGIAWCFGLHDHGWKERPVFGKLRYMNANGLKRKFDMEAYIKRCELF